MLLVLTAGLTWYGKGKHAFPRLTTSELHVYNNHGTLALAYTVYRLKQQHTLVILPGSNRQGSADFLLPSFARWDLITASTDIPPIRASRPPEHWYVLTTTSPPLHHNQSILPVPEDFDISPFKEMVRQIDLFKEDISCFEINLDRTSILYCTVPEDIHEATGCSATLNERYNLVLLHTENSALCRTIHNKIHPYYTITSPLCDTATTLPKNMLSFKPGSESSFHFSPDNRGYLTLLPPLK